MAGTHRQKLGQSHQESWTKLGGIEHLRGSQLKPLFAGTEVVFFLFAFALGAAAQKVNQFLMVYYCETVWEQRARLTKCSLTY
jgi:hypothetical protein